MKVHIVVSVFGGVPEGVKAFVDKDKAEEALADAKRELGIEADSESPNQAELFYNVPIQ